MASYYKLSAAQGDTENCVAHNGSLIPVPGRDIEVQAWYKAASLYMDFTDAAKPFEIAYFDRGPIVRRCWCWVASGRHIGTTAAFTVRRLRVAWTSLELTPTSPDAERNRRGESGSRV